MARGTAQTPKSWQNRAVLREIDDRHVRRLWRLVLSMVVAAAPMAVYVLQQNESLKLVYEINALRAERERLLTEERRLNVEKTELESLARIERWALQERDLVLPDGDFVVVVPAAETETGALVASGPQGVAKPVR
jgi:cell division protein FtsL